MAKKPWEMMDRDEVQAVTLGEWRVTRNKDGIYRANRPDEFRMATNIPRLLTALDYYTPTADEYTALLKLAEVRDA